MGGGGICLVGILLLSFVDCVCVCVCVRGGGVQHELI